MVKKQNEVLKHKIELKDIKLNSILEITTAINENLPVENILDIYSFVLKEQLGFKKFVILHQTDNQWSCILKKGLKTKIVVNQLIQELNRFTDITIVDSSNNALLDNFDAIIPVIHHEKPLAYVLVSRIETKTDKKIKDDHLYLSFIQTLSNIVSVAIENKSILKKSLAQEAIKKELEVAREMQKLLFPDFSNLPSNFKMDISAKFIPRHAIGGDYYDFIPLGDDEYIFCIADVSGKGITAALLMANFQATVRTLFRYQRFEMAFLMEELNKKVMKSAKGEKFITFFIGHYNAFTREMKYINAGHNQPFILHGNSSKLLDIGCIGLGMMDEIPNIEVGKINIDPKSTLIMYTDGVVEQENAKGKQFGLKRLIREVKAFSTLSMADMNYTIFSKLDEWKEDLNYTDDTAILAVRFGKQ